MLSRLDGDDRAKNDELFLSHGVRSAVRRVGHPAFRGTDPVRQARWPALQKIDNLLPVLMR